MGLHRYQSLGHYYGHCVICDDIDHRNCKARTTTFLQAEIAEKTALIRGWHCDEKTGKWICPDCWELSHLSPTPATQHLNGSGD